MSYKICAASAALLIALTLTRPALGNDAAPATACTDFFDYVNGAWLASTPIPPDRAVWGAFAELDRRTKNDLRGILERAASDGPPANAGSGARKVVQFYRAGMDVDAVEKAGIAPLAPEFARIEAMRSRDDLVGELAHLHHIGVAAGFELGYTIDVSDSTHYLPELYQAGLGLPERDYYFRSDAKSQAQRADYVKHIARMLELLGDAPDRASSEAATVMQIETRLAQASMTREQQRDPKAVNNRTRAADLPALAPGIDWPSYRKAAGIAEFAAFNVGQPEFLKLVGEAVRNVPLADWKAYLRWQLVHATATKLSSAFVDENFRFYGVTLYGQKQLSPREERVINVITGAYGDAPMGMALGELFVAERFTPQAKVRALALVENIRAVLKSRIPQLDWMSETTKAAALAKLDAMVVKVGYPDQWRDYASLSLDDKPYVLQWLAANEFEHARVIAMMRKPVDRREWFTSPHLINAFYQAHTNSIVFPAAVLQPPFFDPDRDDAMNYGAIGSLIGHEITHGFDDQGRQFDAVGNLREWWQPEDARRYLERAERVTRQYDAYASVDDLHVNGKLTLGENIADIGGLKLAYLAMQRALAAKPQAAIDGRTPDQRFFIAFAQFWRAKMTPEVERLLVQTDTHSPARFRVQGAVANMPEFARAFSCAAGDPMTRAASDRAAIW